MAETSSITKINLAIYAIYVITTSRLISMTGTQPDEGELLLKGLASKFFPNYDPETQMWDEATLTFIPRPGSRTISKDIFLERFTLAEFSSIIGSDFRAAPAAVSALVRYLGMIDNVDLDSPKLQAGFAQLVTSSFLTQARADVILA